MERLLHPVVFGLNEMGISASSAEVTKTWHFGLKNPQFIKHKIINLIINSHCCKISYMYSL